MVTDSISTEEPIPYPLSSSSAPRVFENNLAHPPVPESPSTHGDTVFSEALEAELPSPLPTIEELLLQNLEVDLRGEPNHAAELFLQDFITQEHLSHADRGKILHMLLVQPQDGMSSRFLYTIADRVGATPFLAD